MGTAAQLLARRLADPSAETDVPFVVEVPVGKTWGDCEVVGEGLWLHGLTEEDEQAPEIGGAAPWLRYFEQDTEAAVEEEEPVTA